MDDIGKTAALRAEDVIGAAATDGLGDMEVLVLKQGAGLVAAHIMSCMGPGKGRHVNIMVGIAIAHPVCAGLGGWHEGKGKAEK